jgi:acyl-CoA oxidase
MAVLGPRLSQAFVIRVIGRCIEDLLIENNKQVAQDNFKLLDVMHHLTAGIKSIATDIVYQGVDALRQACGGAGFLANSGFIEIWEGIVPYPTYEGVNVVMLQ